MELSLGKQLRYSLWIIPLALSAFWALMNVLSWGASHYVSESTNYYNFIINTLCPLGYALAWLTSKSREDRLAFLAALTIHLLLISVAIIGNVLRAPRAFEYIVAWVLQAEALGAFVIALMRRKAVVVRALLWHEPEQREARKLEREMRAEAREVRQEERREAKLRQEEALIESERQKMTGQAQGKRGGRRMKPEASTRALDVDVPDTTSQTAPGSALAAALGATPATAAALAPAVETLQEAGTPQAPAVEAGSPSGVRVDMAPSTKATPTPASAMATPVSPTRVQGDSSSMVDVNTCTPTELLTLSGMTAATARAIVDEREAHGPYRSVEDVVARNGLKPHVVASFITHLSVSEAPVQPKQEGRRGRVLDL